MAESKKKNVGFGEGTGAGMSYSKEDGFYNEADVFGNAFFGRDAKKKEKQAAEEAERVRALWDGVEDPETYNYIPEEMEWLGDYAPTTVSYGDDVGYQDVDARLSDIALADRSSMNDISMDPRLRDAQLGSLSALDDIVAEGGLTASDRAALNQIQSEVAQADRGRREAVMQNMSMRGMGGSGMELLAMLDSGQAATDRANQSGLDIAGMAQQRALEAMLQSGNLAGDIRGQDFGEQADIAAANDAIEKFNAQNMNQGNQFNTNAQNNMAQFNANNSLQNNQFNKSNRMNVDQYNAGALTEASKYNAAGANATQVGNVNNRNAAQIQNNITNPQQKFQNQLAKVAGQAGAAQFMTDQAQRNADRQAQKDAGTLNAGGQIVGSIIGAVSDKTAKKEIKSIDKGEIDEFLKAIEPKKFKYKEPEKPGRAPGERVGFMLQDVAGTELGKKIISKDEDGVMSYDRDNLNGIILAALSDMAKGGK